MKLTILNMYALRDKKGAFATLKTIAKRYNCVHFILRQIVTEKIRSIRSTRFPFTRNQFLVIDRKILIVSS